MMPGTKKRIEKLERDLGREDGAPWSIEKRLRKLEDHFHKLCQHLNVQFHEVPEHTRLVTKGGPKKGEG